LDGVHNKEAFLQQEEALPTSALDFGTLLLCNTLTVLTQAHRFAI